jgi:hypothetical protein
MGTLLFAVLGALGIGVLIVKVNAWLGIGIGLVAVALFAAIADAVDEVRDTIRTWAPRERPNTRWTE